LFCGAALLGAFSFSREKFMEGQVKFFITENAWGLVRDPETNREFHVHINDIVDRVPLERNNWVSFDLASRKGRNQTSAVNVVPIDCPARYLRRGTITRFVEDKGFGFIKYKNDGHIHSVFFHIKDFLQSDGAELVPRVGCEVSFCLGRKTNQPIAALIWIEEWPEELTIEEQFAAAEELPVDVPKPIVAEPKSLLSPATKNLSLIEIMNRRRRKGIQND
jgi:cold shock CspA family protein